MEHSFRLVCDDRDRPSKYDDFRTVVCSNCGLKYVASVKTGSPVTGDLLRMYPNCDVLVVAEVMES